jgi:hypothetical protein
VKTKVNFRVSEDEGYFLNSWGKFSFWRRILA